VKGLMMQLDYFFDPLCGWCYASAAALAGLAKSHGEALVMRPSGLFMPPRPISSIADHAWSNDQRIAALTGVTFSQAYHDKVLHAPGAVFSSRPLSLALQALGQVDRGLEPRFLHQAQIARYVRAEDTSQVAPVVAIAADLMQAAGHAFDAAEFADRLQSDTALAEALDARVAETNRMQANLPRGVPLLLVTAKGRSLVLNGEAIYHGPDRVRSAIAAFQAS
jgi:putative protein-disulfide isomerase